MSTKDFFTGVLAFGIVAVVIGGFVYGCTDYQRTRLEAQKDCTSQGASWVNGYCIMGRAP